MRRGGTPFQPLCAFLALASRAAVSCQSSSGTMRRCSRRYRRAIPQSSEMLSRSLVVRHSPRLSRKPNDAPGRRVGLRPVGETTGSARVCERAGVSHSCGASKELKAVSACALQPTGCRALRPIILSSKVRKTYGANRVTCSVWRHLQLALGSSLPGGRKRKCFIGKRQRAARSQRSRSTSPRSARRDVTSRRS